MQAIAIDGYRIESELAAARGCRLLRARQLLAGHPVLIQLWDGPPEPARAAVRTLAGLRHPGLATVLDVGDADDGRVYAALAAPPGGSLAERFAAGLDQAQSLDLLRRLAQVLQFLESRSARPPSLAPGEILFDAQARPVLTRLLEESPAPQVRQEPPVRLALHLFYEALTGHPSAQPRPRLPDYLQQWQPLLDLCEDSAVSPARVLSVLEALQQGRSPDLAPDMGEASTTSSAVDRSAPGAPLRQEGATAPFVAVASGLPAEATTVPAKPVAEPPAPRPLPPKASAPAGSAGRPVTTAPKASAGVSEPRPRSSAPTPASPRGELPSAVGATAGSQLHERVTAPSRRLPDELAQPPSPAKTGGGALPEPDRRRSRLPLLIAAGVALPLIAGIATWLLQTPATPGRPDAPAAAVSPRLPAPEPAPVAPPPSSAATAGFRAPDPAEDWTPAVVGELDLSALPTVEDPLERLLLFARTNVQAGRLVEPPGRNALDRYLQALRIDPNHRGARTGLAELGGLCVDAAREATDLDAQLASLGCAERVAAAHEAAARPGQQARDLRQSLHDARVAEGDAALAAWRTAEAAAAFRQAQRLLPQSSQAERGLREAERVGRPGYRFRDALQGGGRGPEMLVAGGLAWSRSEIRVDEFEVYWLAAGRARFGNAMPACRDRESLLRSSRRRDWRTPDFPQTPAHPVACVSFAMAQHYAEWLSEASGRRYRLPRLAEWQGLAGRPPEGCVANFRDRAASREWNARETADCDDGHGYTAPAHQAAETAGVRGLWGNLAEWLEDCEDGNCRQRLAAGGSWFSRSTTDVGARGFAAEPAFTTIGIRVVRELPARD